MQLGYLVLFALAYPLAPFLAFIKNILEIRFGSYKMSCARDHIPPNVFFFGFPRS